MPGTPDRAPGDRRVPVRPERPTGERPKRPAGDPASGERPRPNAPRTGERARAGGEPGRARAADDRRPAAPQRV
ncbi:hypothetical protein AB0425_19380, partial [Actinosynnema sp. NPDC051121]